MRLLIAGGGTGGHVFPGLSVARSLRARPDAPELEWVGGHRGQEGRIVPGAGIPLHRLALRSLRSAGRDIHLVTDPLRLAASIPQAMALLARRRPAAIFTTGGYVAIPIAVAAGPLGIPVVLWEGNVIPGRSVRAIARLADVRTVSFAPTCAALGGRGPCYVTGTPIRVPRAIDSAAAREALGVGADARVLLVFGGSQSVRRFNDAVAAALPTLVERATVIHVTGEAAYAEALAARQALPEATRQRYRPSHFLEADDMATALVAADLVVGRAGSSTLAEVTAAGRPMIVVPYPHAAGHQRANAAVLADAGAARLVDDAAFDGNALLAATELLDDRPALAAMAAAASSLGRPAAADAVADLVMAVALRAPLPDAAANDRRSRGQA